MANTIIKKKTEAPLFLAKTYAMVNSADGAICTWSDHGDMFVIKDADIFAAEVIPKFFKHSNFSSFVRQLNFYGFRKIRTEAIFFDKTSSKSQQEAKFWRFRHEKFVRGKPELLVEMRRDFSKSGASTQVVDKQMKEDVTTLKTQVQALEAKLKHMTSDIDSLTSQVKQMTVGDNKKRKIPACSTQMVFDDESEEVTSSLADEFDSMFGDEDIMPVCDLSLDSLLSDNQILPDEVPSSVDAPSCVLSSVQEVVPGVMPSLPVIPSNSAVTVSQTVGNKVDPKLMQGVHDCLAVLPPNMQQMFVDRLVNTLVSQSGDVSNLALAMVTSLAAMVPPGASSQTQSSDSKTSTKQQQMPFISCSA